MWKHQVYKLLSILYVVLLCFWKDVHFNFLVVGLLYILGISSLIRQRRFWLRDPIIIVGVIFVVYLITNFVFIARVPWSVFRMEDFWFDDAKMIFGLVFLLVPVIMRVNHVDPGNVLIKYLIPAYLVLIFFSLIQYFSGIQLSGLELRHQLVLIGGQLGKALIAGHLSQNPLAAFSLFPVTYLLLKLIYERFQPSSVVAFIVGLFGLVLTFSRSGLIGFFVALLGLVTILVKRRNLFVVNVRFLGLLFGLVLLLISSLVFFSPSWRLKVSEIISLSGNNITSRLYLWNKALTYIGDAPLFGIGYTRYNDANLIFKDNFFGIKTVVSGVVINSESHAHNSYLQLLSETGIAGLGLYILFLGLAIHRVILAYRNTGNIYDLAILLSIMGLLVTSLFENNLAAPSITSLYMYLIGGYIKYK